ncbi:MAG: ABC transporter substrate-binding protein [Myxococcales bacterium]|nr:ABC transporter substrate-binding protein [Myxococcales bacterium]
MPHGPVHFLTTRLRQAAGRSVVSLVLAVSAAPAGADAPQDAVSAIEGLHDTLIAAMKDADALGFAGRRELIAPAATDVFDFTFMAVKSLGPHARKLSEGDRLRWIDAFALFVTSNLARQFDGYSGEVFETRAVDSAPRDTLIVQTVLVRPDDDDVRLYYRLRSLAVSNPASAADDTPAETTDGEVDDEPETAVSWHVIDVYSNGTVSELALRRSEFSGLFRRQGFEKLVETVVTKANRE